MFCMKCGNKLSEGAAFCHKCGVKTGTSEAPLNPSNELMTVTNDTSGHKAEKYDVILTDAGSDINSVASRIAKKSGYTGYEVGDVMSIIPIKIVENVSKSKADSTAASFAEIGAAATVTVTGDAQTQHLSF